MKVGYVINLSPEGNKNTSSERHKIEIEIVSHVLEVTKYREDL